LRAGVAFALVTLVAACGAGAIASVAGFGIGSVLTPLLSIELGTRLAVAAVSIPHVAGTALRFWILRRRIDARVFLSFGVTSAAGGLAGALLHNQSSNRALGLVFALLLLFAGAAELTGFMRRVRLGRPAAWVAGAASGFFGGLVGNQGGIRSAALLAFDVDKTAFVATATAIGLVVDGARMPVYLASDGAAMARVWPLIACATIGVVAGTLAGARLLARVPERHFRTTIAVLLLALGVWMLARA
jgi:uncharacterized membrane protein YfcA